MTAPPPSAPRRGAYLRSMLIRLHCWLACPPRGIASHQHSELECCEDNDLRRRAIRSMRDECWRTGV